MSHTVPYSLRRYYKQLRDRENIASIPSDFTHPSFIDAMSDYKDYQIYDEETIDEYIKKNQKFRLVKKDLKVPYQVKNINADCSQFNDARYNRLLYLLRYNNTIEYLSLDGCYVPNDLLLLISKFPYLKKLNLAHSGLENGSGQLISSIKTLESLNICDNRNLSVDDFQNISKLPNLKDINLSELTIIEQSQQELLKLINITKLTLHYTTIDSATFDFILNFKKLEELYIESRPVEDYFIKISELEHLKKLQLTDCMLIPTELKNISKLTKLKELYINLNNVEDNGITIISNLKSLEILNVSNNNLTERSIPILSQFKNLKTIIIVDNLYSSKLYINNIPLVELEKLSKAIPHLNIIL